MAGISLPRPWSQGDFFVLLAHSGCCCCWAVCCLSATKLVIECSDQPVGRSIVGSTVLYYVDAYPIIDSHVVSVALDVASPSDIVGYLTDVPLQPCVLADGLDLSIFTASSWLVTPSALATATFNVSWSGAVRSPQSRYRVLVVDVVLLSFCPTFMFFSRRVRLVAPSASCFGGRQRRIVLRRHAC